MSPSHRWLCQAGAGQGGHHGPRGPAGLWGAVGVAKRRHLITAHSIPFNCLLNPNQPISGSNYSFIQ